MFQFPVSFNPNVLNRAQDPKEKRFLCTYLGCAKRFNRKFTLSEHMKTHTGVKPYICDYKGCDRRFSTSGNLSRHKYTHTGERPYSCEKKGCTKRFCTREKLSRHTKTHSGQRPHHCRFAGCTKRFTTSGNLGRHMKTHRKCKPMALDLRTQRAELTPIGLPNAAYNPITGPSLMEDSVLDHEIISALSSPVSQEHLWFQPRQRHLSTTDELLACLESTRLPLVRSSSYMPAGPRSPMHPRIMIQRSYSENRVRPAAPMSNDESSLESLLSLE